MKTGQNIGKVVKRKAYWDNSPLYFYILLCSVFVFLSMPQGLSAQERKQTIFLDSSTYIYHFSVTDKKHSIKNKKFYTWYKAGRIQITQFGYGEKLLDGKFTKNFLSKNLSEQGYYRKGLKSGIWKTWYENGFLSKISEWQKGEINGKMQQFDSAGKILLSGRVKDEQFSGQEYKYIEDRTDTVVYKKGVKLAVQNHKKDSTQNRDGN